jgi:hypothetical protein
MHEFDQLTILIFDYGITIRLMGDYEVNLVNDNMQEFYVRFNGPDDSSSNFVPI